MNSNGKKNGKKNKFLEGCPKWIWNELNNNCVCECGDKVWDPVENKCIKNNKKNRNRRKEYVSNVSKKVKRVSV